MQEIIELVVKTYGIAGLIMLSPILGMVLLFREYVSKERSHREGEKAWSDKIEKLQEMRINDAKAMGESLMSLAKEQAALAKESNLALDRLNEALTSIQAVMSSVRR